ncbi:4-alpha-glucanotransferase [[Pantoea] beijingensis]|uniref:4-alpha-glucanotransferase n=1 Tax=[Pantoea] beijingensis TaxID=1324864 RepID=A0A443IED9_9GAMM|nr:4-alpha-glucanotransferase [[Pantoea] beijingensis]RWR02426.1 4-alpha-glucanotransferase [[Pantoea] beijingensis]
MDLHQLDKAATAAGIASSYINAEGEQQAIEETTRRRLLAAMGKPTLVSASPLPAAKVFSGTRKRQLLIGGKGCYRWHLQTEHGKQHEGEVQAGETLSLPSRLADGYHQLTLTQGKQQWPCRIIVAPTRCFEPAPLREGKKLWGTCVQLYTLRSENNWGIGDFGDLHTMLDNIADRGGAFIGLNPIHSLYPANPESASPYSPSSRRWLNVIYIDVSRVPDFQQSEAAQRWWQQDTTQQTLAQVRQSEWVDYTTVSELKMTALRLAWQQFSTRAENDTTRALFKRFITLGGGSLFYQAAYDAMHQAMLKQDPQFWGWPVWPEAYQHAHNDAVQKFCQQNQDEVNFWLWLQWLANLQFDACWQQSQRRNMPIGLYRDLAVGVAEGGSEAWSDRELYCLKASIGAPPDILGPLGQNWGLPPMDPHVMAARGYQPFIDLLRANMASCGALRIDHVMSMLRLWWIPYGETADHGAYVYYPVDDLMAILALESQRNQCMVIGEDLGTVPVEIIGKLRDSGVYSWKVLYFEQESADRYRAPDAWQTQSMASATTHDLPTLRGFWASGDLALGETLGLYPDEVILRGLYENRDRQKQALLNALHQYHFVPKRFGKRASHLSMSPQLNRGMHRFIADSGCALLGLQPEDWLDMAMPVNIPGTTDQYPNWRRKLSHTLEAMFADDGVNRLIRDIDRRRKKA